MISPSHRLYLSSSNNCNNIYLAHEFVYDTIAYGNKKVLINDGGRANIYYGHEKNKSYKNPRDGVMTI